MLTGLLAINPTVSQLEAEAPGTPQVSQNETASRWDRFGPDESWCGPRILYFFNRYFGDDATLEQIVGRSNVTPEGWMSLASVVEAAETLGLEPEPIEVSAPVLLRLGGPAIIVVDVQRPFRDQDAKKGDSTRHIVHFVGLVGQEHADKWWIVDPARVKAAREVDRAAIERNFSGHAVLLKGCPRPSVLPHWLVPAVGWPTALLAVGWLGWIAARRRLHRPRRHTS
jgi:ABC-type bacteriocin/lantibiotic exporter with double-glycine peptidase domain